MTAARRRFDLPPRIMSEVELATYIGRGLTWFRENRERLEAMGLPRPLPLLGGYDRCAVDSWIDRLGGREGLSAPTRSSEAWVRAAGG